VRPRAWRDGAIGWLVPLLLILAWQAASSAHLLSFRVLPAPLDVLAALIASLKDGSLLHHVAVSFGRALRGLVIGGGLGFGLGLLTGMAPWAEKLFDSSLQMLRNIPHLAVIPLVILWFGIDEQAKIFIVALGVFFPLYINSFHGVRDVDPALIEMGRVYGLSRWAVAWRVVLPGALPQILVGLRFSLGLMWLSLIVAETISANAGIGYMTMNAREFLQTDVVVLGILLYALLGKLADLITRQIERRVLAWHPAHQAAAAANLSLVLP
jgi:sulfonate transport system permease protein